MILKIKRLLTEEKAYKAQGSKEIVFFGFWTPLPQHDVEDKTIASFIGLQT